MIQVALDWNCIIDLEEERESASAIRQIQALYNQGRIALCISSPSRMENPRIKIPTDEEAAAYNYPIVIEEEEWNKKMRGVGLEGIELRSASTVSFLGADGSYNFDFTLEQLVMRQIHEKLFPKIDFYLQDYYRRRGVEPIDMNNRVSIGDAFNAASKKQRSVERTWNNAKCDSLSLYAFSTWSGPDDVFVTSDDDDFIQNRELLNEPFHIQRQVMAPPPGYTGTFEESVILTEQTQNITISGVVKGHILSPQEAVEYLHRRLEE